jgi:hypothetical protein
VIGGQIEGGLGLLLFARCRAGARYFFAPFLSSAFFLGLRFSLFDFI